MTTAISFCNFEGAQWLLFGPNVAPLVYYSHLPVVIISLLLGFFVLHKNRKSLPNQVLFYTIVAFAIWVICDSIYWASNRSDVIMFVWAIDVLVEPLVYIGALYLLYTLVGKRDMRFSEKISLGILYLPVILLLPTPLVLSGFNITTCLANEGPVALYYSYFIEIVVTILALQFCVKNFLRTRDKALREEILYLGAGTMFLLLAFSWGNIIGSFTENWQLGQYGLFGMPIFLGLLVYSMVKFRIFNIKIIGSTALVLALWVLTAALLSIQDPDTIHAVVGGTLILTTLFGWILINSVRQEVVQREIIETQKEALQKSNEGQENLIHIMNHQVKGYLSKSRNIFAELQTDDYGHMPDEVKPMIKEGLTSLTEAVGFVQEVLNGSSAASGMMVYAENAYDFGELVKEVADSQKSNAEERELTFDLELVPGEYHSIGDNVQLREAIKNLIDNSIHYTLKGGLKVKLESKDEKMTLSVQDTGVGISEEDKPKLFTKGGRGKDSLKININSTGYGLAFVKAVVEAHKGRVWVESEGSGKGSTFYLELPIRRK
ncbi:MAG: sensor signal transduction histidine kinase [Parcubacteria group bacterium]|nr:sensor signal transduction histidine kinase [Parcubacteria group bacterium]